MNDLALHILDIIQNSISAGATMVGLSVEEDIPSDRLVIEISDNGRGMDPAQLARLADPFFTSRTTRKVGMGIPLFKQTAEQSGGGLSVTSEPGKGTVVRAVFQHSNIDRPPLGNVPNVLMLTVASNPDVDFEYRYSYNGSEYVFSTREAKEVLGDMEIGNPTVMRYLEEMIAENMNEVRK